MSKKHIQPNAGQPFYKILTEEGGDEATMLLYGYVGEEWTWSEDDGWKMGGITDIDFVREFNRLAAQYKRIHLRLNSYGGDFRHGNAIMTAIASSSAEVHTWNDGIAASMAADIWLCGHVRHMAKNALLMIHPTWSMCVGNAKDMRECADVMDKMSEAAIIATAAATGISEDDMRSRYYADYADHWLTYADAATDGLVSDTEEYEAAGISATSKALQAMTYKEVLQLFEGNTSDEPAAPPGLMARLRNAVETRFGKIAGHAPAKPSPVHAKTTTTDMTIEEFRTSLSDGTLDLAAVKAHLAEVEAAAAPPAVPEPVAADPLEPILKELAALKAELNAAKAQLDDYAKRPGAGKSTPGMPKGDPVVQPTPDALADYNKTLAGMAENGAVPFRPQH
jgi:ATP-dependent protease ClpP protease subunit